MNQDEAVSSAQLTIDGREVSIAESQPAALTDCQRAILRHVRTHKGVTSTEAGRIVHAHRPTPCPPVPVEARRVACCKFASEDGRAACTRLADRGMLERVSPGLWGFP